ncbi:MAG: tyrosine-type recombinase/integrase [Victivallales bacterium]|nr:tyrosine-type recombinase/integrase [Victivallales bacterium]
MLNKDERMINYIEDFFCKYMMQQRNCSPETIASYRDAFNLFLAFLQKTQKTLPQNIVISDFSSKNVLNFLDYLESCRMNKTGTRNSRLTALRTFIKYITMRTPLLTVKVQAILTIPIKKSWSFALEYLAGDEIRSVLNSIDQNTWSGKRDHALFALMYNTGARVSEAINLTVSNFKLLNSGTVHLLGKGRKERTLPLWKSTTKELANWINFNGFPKNGMVFPNAKGQQITRSGVIKRLKEIVKCAAQNCPSLAGRRITPHTLRHTTAMHLLESGVDITVIAMWLGHENIQTTHGYITANMALKEKALSSLQEPKQKSFRYHPSDKLLAFLNQL